MLRDGQLGGGGGGGEAPERDRQSHHWDVLSMVQEEPMNDEGAVGVGLVTETSAWQMHLDWESVFPPNLTWIIL